MRQPLRRYAQHRHADQRQRHPGDALAAGQCADADQRQRGERYQIGQALGHDDGRGARHRDAVRLAQEIRLQHLAHFSRRHRERKTR